MLAKVTMSFKYIGGQGLRRYVDQFFWWKFIGFNPNC
jgi:hypothetical protein